MKLKYQELVKKIMDIPRPEKWDLKRIKLLCNLSNVNYKKPNFKVIHITGTNGKGSCSASTSSILSEAGYKVGLYTSPHLMKINERIKINGIDISNRDFEKYGNEILSNCKKMKDQPSFFEIITCIALKYFQEKRIDFLVSEVGLGGRLDATNILDGYISVITNVDFDHMKYLGKSIQSIAKEKCGIIKKNNFVVSCAKRHKARKVIADISNKMNSKLFLIGKDFHIHQKGISLKGTRFSLKYGGRERNYFTNLIGVHQSYNIGASIMVSRILNRNKIANIREKDIAKGIKNIKWPARFEIVSEKPLVILDGAHNTNGIKYLIKTLKGLKIDGITFVIAIFRDKEYDKMIRDISKSEIAKNLIFTKSDSPRASNPEELILHVPKEFKGKKELYQNFNRALKRAEELSQKIVVCGSLYNSKYVYNYFKRIKKNRSIQF